MADQTLVQGEIQKVDEDNRLVFGWAYVAKRASGEQIHDHSGDFVIDVEGLEKAAYDYVLSSREGDQMHTVEVTSTLVESVMFTPAKLEKMGLPEDALPVGWWVGFHVADDDTWTKVKDGKLRMFSIAGAGVRESVE